MILKMQDSEKMSVFIEKGFDDIWSECWLLNNNKEPYICTSCFINLLISTFNLFKTITRIN